MFINFCSVWFDCISANSFLKVNQNILQDTLIAMEALFEFTQVDPNRNVFDILIRMEASSTPNWISLFAMDKSNYTEMQHSYVSYLDLVYYKQSLLVC